MIFALSLRLFEDIRPGGVSGTLEPNGASVSSVDGNNKIATCFLSVGELVIFKPPHAPTMKKRKK